jgi:hypothetical protein
MTTTNQSKPASKRIKITKKANVENAIPATSNVPVAVETPVQTKQKAFAVYAHISNGKINNIVVIDASFQLNQSDMRIVGETHDRIGTIHANDLFVKIHKGFAGKDEPNGKQYACHEKGKYIPYEDGNLRKMYFMCRLKKDLAIARDIMQRPIIDPNTKQPMTCEVHKVAIASLINTGKKEVIDEMLKARWTMPFAIYTTDEKAVFTFYTIAGNKYFVRPSDEAPKKAIKNDAVVEKSMEVATATDDMPF